MRQKGPSNHARTDSQYNVHVTKFEIQAAGMRSVAKRCVAFVVPFARSTVSGCPGIVWLTVEEAWAWATNLRVHRLHVRMVSRHDWENHCREEPNCSKQKRFPSFLQCRLLRVSVCTQVVLLLQLVGLQRRTAGDCHLATLPFRARLLAKPF